MKKSLVSNILAFIKSTAAESKKPSFLVLASLCLMFFLTQPAKAQTSLDYYRSLFKSWGISVDIVQDSELQKLTAPATKKDLDTLFNELSRKPETEMEPSQDIEKIPSENAYLLILESQQNQKLPPYKNIIVITNSLEFLDISLHESSSSSIVLQALKPAIVGDAKFYSIPQIFLVTPEYQKSVSAYFRAISKAEDAKRGLASKEKTTSTAAQILAKIKTSSILESAGYALAILIFVSIFIFPLKVLVRNPNRFLEKSFYTEALTGILNFLNKNSNMIGFVFIVLALFYIPILYTLNIKARILGDSSYAVKYLITTLNPLNIPNYLTSQNLFRRNLFRIGLLFYNYALALFGLFLLIPRLTLLLTGSIDKFREIKFKPNFIKWAIPTIVLTNSLLLAFVDWEVLIGFLTLSVVVLLASLLYIRSRWIDYAQIFSAKEKLLLAITMTVILVLNIVYPLYVTNRPIKYVYEPLIGIKDNVVAFPYSKKWGNNVLFEPHYYNGNSKVFVDSYLIYAPPAQKIVNKPLKNFSPESSFTITGGSSEAFFEAVLKTPKLLPFITTDTFSPLLALDNKIVNTPSASVLKAQMIFNCYLAPSPVVVKLEIMSLNKYALEQTDSKDSKLDPINAESVEILNFPGCSQGIAQETFEIPLDSYLIPQEFILLRLRGINLRYLAGFKLFLGSQELPVQYINKDVLGNIKYPLLYSSGDSSKEIIAYSSQVKKDFVVDLQNTEEGFDLSNPINELMKRGLLNNPFIIWTNVENELIRINTLKQ